MSPSRFAPAIAVGLLALGLQGCVATVVGATAGAVVGVAGAAVVTTAKVGGAVVGAAIPDGDKKDAKGKKDR
ncbi:MAG: hypothetical protein Q7T19_00065 [Caulobacter sp.]|nr:hypothetical protein [Caulobacter sp.]